MRLPTARVAPIRQRRGCAASDTLAHQAAEERNGDIRSGARLVFAPQRELPF